MYLYKYNFMTVTTKLTLTFWGTDAFAAGVDCFEEADCVEAKSETGFTCKLNLSSEKDFHFCI